MSKLNLWIQFLAPFLLVINVYSLGVSNQFKKEIDVIKSFVPKIYKSKKLKKSLNYRIYLPYKQMQPDKKYPLIL